VCSVFIVRKRLIKKAMLLEIDEDLKNLAPKEFFLNILKREKFSKIINYVGFLFFLLFSIFIVFQGYQEYILFKENLKSAQVDFMIPNKIVETGLLGNDIKFGSKFLFVIYPGYIIPYCWLDDVKIVENPGRYGSKSHYVNIILKTSSKPINITFAKKEICEKIRELLLKKYKEQKKIK